MYRSLGEYSVRGTRSVIYTLFDVKDKKNISRFGYTNLLIFFSYIFR